MPHDTARLWGKTDREEEYAIADGGRRRARRLAATVLFTGLLLLAAIWWGINDIVVDQRDSAVQHAVVDARNLDIAFQEEITNILNADAVAMKIVADRMRAEPGRFDINAWARDIPLLSRATLHASIIGPDGKLQSSTLQEDPEPLDLSDREHFRVHLDDHFKGIYVSRPVRGRLSHQVTI